MRILDLGFWILEWVSARLSLGHFAGTGEQSEIQNPKSKAVLFFILLLFTIPARAQNPQAQLSWWDRAPEEKAGKYWIKSDLEPEDNRWIAAHLNIMYAEYSKRLASLPVRAEEKLNVLLFRDRADYNLTLRARFGVNPAGTGGMFFVGPSGGGLALWTEGLPRRRIEHVIQHEGFHQFAYSRFGADLPIWVNEGLAEFFGESVVIEGELVIGQSTPRVIDAVKNAIELNEYIPFRAILGMTPLQWASAVRNENAGLQYHQAWSMVHFLVYSDGGRYVGAFETYLRHLNNGLPSEEAFKRSFGPDIIAFEETWKKYAQAAKPSAFVTALERIEFLAEGALELSRRKVVPDSLDALKSALREIKFTHSVETHGAKTVLSAEDDAMFTIPKDDLCAEPPNILISKPDLGRMTRKQQILEEAQPTPSTIETENLRPRGMRIRWNREPKDNSFRYQIDVR